MIYIDRNTEIGNTRNVVNEKTPSFSGIVNQECKGRLWVDNITTPRIAIAESFAVESFAFLGTYEADEDFKLLKNFLENELFSQLRDNGCSCFEFSINTEGIHDHILNMFQNKHIESEQEYSFRATSIPVNSTCIPANYQIQKVDTTFWNRLLEGKYDNSDFIKSRLLESWYSFEDFMNKSIAYCTIKDSRIVAVMVGTASYNHVIAIDIETEEEHRRLGLSYAMAQEFISDCFQNNYVPQWDCVESNLSSYNLARKLGLEKIGENTVYWFHI